MPRARQGSSVLPNRSHWRYLVTASQSMPSVRVSRRPTCSSRFQRKSASVSLKKSRWAVLLNLRKLQHVYAISLQRVTISQHKQSVLTVEYIFRLEGVEIYGTRCGYC